MKVAITGHTRGIGAEIYNYFSAQGHECVGFSRATGHDIVKSDSRQQIISGLADCDIFVNNACSRSDDSQLYMLQEAYELWKDADKIIINVGSRAGDFVHQSDHPQIEYFKMKERQDKFCASKHNKVWLINLRPGTVDTPFTNKWPGNKMNVDSISKILDFALTNKDSFRIKTITFGL